MSDTSTQNQVKSISDEKRQLCAFCGKSYKSVKIHISKAHPDEYRQSVITKYPVINNNEPPNDDHTSMNFSVSQSQSNNTITDSISHMKPWEDKIENVLINNTPDELDHITTDVIKFFVDSTQTLPGPQHPAIKYYNLRRNGKANKRYAHSETSNPQKRSKREREKRREKYSYDLAQYNFYNHRRKVVRQILNSDSHNFCSVPKEEAEIHFRKILGCINDMTSINPPPACADLDITDILEITTKDVNIALSKIKIDTAPGPDRVSVRVLKHLKAAKFISLLGTAMLRFGFVPTDLRKARTILIHKGGDSRDLRNWRPITIFSVIRRLIERVLDKILRNYLSLSSHQKGFIPTPGTHINTSLIDGCLKAAKSSKSDCFIAFLDVSKAFDSVGHEHIRRSLDSVAMPPNLRKLLSQLLINNHVQIEVANGKTKPIPVNTGVPQGSPLSPTLFNLALDNIIRDLNDTELSAAYGFSLNPALSNLSAIAFADDIALISRSDIGIQSLISLAENNLSLLGLTINPLKCKLISIQNGVLTPIEVTSINGSVIKSISNTECIKYLGVNFKDEIVFDEHSTVKKFSKSISKLCQSPLLKPDQKISIINQYVWPSLIYPLQCAPLTKLRKGFLEDLDKITRGACKELIGLPHDCPNGMLYAPKKFRGLALMRASWEANIQHINICDTLLKVEDQHLHFVRDFAIEKASALSQLNVATADATNWSGRRIRNHLRNEAFQSWTKHTLRGKGVTLYSDLPKANSWVSNKKGLSSSEWTNALKMSCNISAVRAIPGRSFNTTRCRFPDCNETETLGHVLGSCPKGELLINARHHKVRSTLALSLKSSGWETHEEVHCNSTDGSFRRADIIAINRRSEKAFILDPTVRFERESNQATEDLEK